MSIDSGRFFILAFIEHYRQKIDTFNKHDIFGTIHPSLCKYGIFKIQLGYVFSDRFNLSSLISNEYGHGFFGYSTYYCYRLPYLRISRVLSERANRLRG